MDKNLLNDLEVAPRSVVMQAARQLAETLGDTSQFKEFEQSYLAFRQDTKTQGIIQEFQKKQAAMKGIKSSSAVSKEDQKELERLQEQFNQQSTVIRYSNAQRVLVQISQQIGDQLSDAIGIDFASACQTGGCCG